MTEKLKRCPFCGGESVTRSRAPGCYRVGCLACNIETDETDEVVAIAAWNRRAMPDRDALESEFCSGCAECGGFSPRDLEALLERLAGK